MSAARILPFCSLLSSLITSVIAGAQNVGVVPVEPCGTDVSAASSAIVASSLQPYCSTLLGYTTPVATVTTTISEVSTETPYGFTYYTVSTDTTSYTVTNTVYTTNPVATLAKRDAAAPTPTALDGFAPSVVTSACSLVATPSTTTEMTTTTSVSTTWTLTWTQTATSYIPIATATVTQALDCGLVAKEHVAYSGITLANCTLPDAANLVGISIFYLSSFSIGERAADGVVSWSTMISGVSLRQVHKCDLDHFCRNPHGLKDPGTESI